MASSKVLIFDVIVDPTSILLLATSAVDVRSRVDSKHAVGSKFRNEGLLYHVTLACSKEDEKA